MKGGETKTKKKDKSEKEEIYEKINQKKDLKKFKRKL